MTPDMQAIVQRLEEAEKQIAHLAALLTERSDPDRAVEAQSFVVRDEAGQRRAELGMSIPAGHTEPHPWLGLFDADARVRACIGVGGRGRSGPTEGPWFEMYNEKGHVGVEIGFSDDNPTVRLFNEDGTPTVALAGSELGPCIAVLNPSGKQRLSMSISLSGDPWLVMEDANGDTVLKLATGQNGPQLVFAKDNKVFWSAP